MGRRQLGIARGTRVPVSLHTAPSKGEGALTRLRSKKGKRCPADRGVHGLESFTSSEPQEVPF